MNTVLVEFTNDMKSTIMHAIGTSANNISKRINIDLTEYNDIKDIIGIYMNGVFVDKQKFYFRNGILEIENYAIDEQDKYFLCA